MNRLRLFVKIVFVRLRFVAVFVVLGLVAANWSWLQNVAHRALHRAEVAAAESDEEWFCPMHPTVIRSTPGKCPICGMDLSRRKKGEAQVLPPGVLARLTLSPLRIRQAGLSTVPVEHRPLVRVVRTVGTIEYDEGRLTDLSARIAGRADELYVQYVGTRVEKGSPIYKIFSPDLVSTQKEYLLALADLRRLEATSAAEATALARARGTVRSGRERLVLWGIAEEQIAELEASGEVQNHLVIRSPAAGVVVEKEIHAGHYVEVGEDPYLIADISSVWVMAEVFERDIGLVRVGQTIEIATEAFPGETFTGVVALLEPSLRTDTRTVRVRADVTNLDFKLRPGMAVTATLRASLGPAGQAPWNCCIDQDGPTSCTECAMAHDGPPPPAADSAERTIWVCPMPVHWTFAADRSGRCELCGMDLMPKVVAAGQELVWTCPEHAAVLAKEPGDCPEGGHRELVWKIVPNPDAPAGGHDCPHPPQPSESGKFTCPECGHEMVQGTRPVLSIPISAVIDTGDRQVVYVDRGEGVYEAVEVAIGPRADQFYPVLSGLALGDRVVDRGAFLLDAEAHLNPATGSAK